MTRTALVLVSCVLLGLLRLPPRKGDPRTRVSVFSVLKPTVARELFKPVLVLVIQLYWLKLVNAIGSAKDEADHEAVADIADGLTALDPDFHQVYWFGGIIVPWARGRNDYVLVDRSSALFDRGLARFPGDTKLKVLRAFNELFYLKNYREAGRFFAWAAKAPDAPPFAGPLATRLLTESGSLDDAVAITQMLLDGARDDDEKALYSERLAQIRTEQTLKRVDEAIGRFRSTQGAEPVRIEQLVAAGLISASETRDAAGEQISIKDGRATSEVSLLRTFKDKAESDDLPPASAHGPN
jgi:hypothetical protein